MKKLLFLFAFGMIAFSTSAQVQYNSSGEVEELRSNGVEYVPIVDLDTNVFWIKSDSVRIGNQKFVAADIANWKTIAGKRRETYSGTTSGSGTYTVTFGTSFAVAPNIQCNLIGNSTNQFVRVSSVSTTGFTVNAYSFNSLNVLGIVYLLPTTTNLNGASVDVLISEK